MYKVAQQCGLCEAHKDLATVNFSPFFLEYQLCKLFEYIDAAYLFIKYFRGP